ncbi:MAG: hypothetical protein WC728_00245 [Elusimicrobiota bacterium]
MAPGILAFSVLFLAGSLHARTYSDTELKRMVAQGGGSASSRRPGPYAYQGLKVILENRFEYRPWLFEQTSKIKNQYGLRAISTLVREFDEVEDGVFEYCADIDTPHALRAFEALAEKYRVILVWQTRWAAEVHTGRESGAYIRVIAGRHTEKDLARAALLDGLKSEVVVRREQRETVVRAGSFEKVLRSALDGLRGSCRMRLSGADVLAREWHEPGVDDDVIVRWTKPSGPPPEEGTCSESRPGKMVLYFGPFYDFYPEGDSDKLRELIVERLGCRPKTRPTTLARAGGLRDALAPVKRRSRRLCPVRRYQAPRVVVAGSRTRRTTTTTVTRRTTATRLITEEMAYNVAYPGQAERTPEADGESSRSSRTTVSNTVEVGGGSGRMSVAAATETDDGSGE